MKQVGLLIVHGIGTQDAGYSMEFQAAVRKQLNCPASSLVIHEVCWQSVLEPEQVKLFQRLKSIKWNTARKLFISYAGDAIEYQAGSDVYDDIHATINEALERLCAQLDSQAPLIIFAHSLGTVVISNFIWDQEQKINLQASHTALDLLTRLQALYTVGSPITVFSLKFKDGGEPIRYSRPWYNIYSPFDIIGYPLKPLNSLYQNKDSLSDLSWIVGGWRTFWTPMSHNEYWTSHKVQRHLIHTIEKLVKS